MRLPGSRIAREGGKMEDRVRESRPFFLFPPSRSMPLLFSSLHGAATWSIRQRVVDAAR